MATVTTNQSVQALSDDDIWGMEVTASGNFDTCPPGNFPGVVVGIFDVGTHPTEYKGKPKDTRQLVLVFELTKKAPSGLPYVLALRLTWSFGSQSNLRPLVESMLGTKFRDGDRFDPRVLSGLPCMVQVVNDVKGEKTYDKIAGVAQFPEGLPAPKPVHQPLVWSVKTGQPFPADSDWLPWVYGQSIRDLAMDSNEVTGRKPRSVGVTPPATNGHAIDPNSSDVPF
jgi:hypothetical protein